MLYLLSWLAPLLVSILVISEQMITMIHTTQQRKMIKAGATIAGMMMVRGTELLLSVVKAGYSQIQLLGTRCVQASSNLYKRTSQLRYVQAEMCS